MPGQGVGEPGSAKICSACPEGSFVIPSRRAHLTAASVSASTIRVRDCNHSPQALSMRGKWHSAPARGHCGRNVTAQEKGCFYFRRRPPCWLRIGDIREFVKLVQISSPTTKPRSFGCRKQGDENLTPDIYLRALRLREKTWEQR